MVCLYPLWSAVYSYVSGLGHLCILTFNFHFMKSSIFEVVAFYFQCIITVSHWPFSVQTIDMGSQ